MESKWCIILNEVTNTSEMTENVLAIFDYENAVDLMTQWFNEIGGYPIEVSERIVDRLLEIPLDASIGEVVDFTNDDMVYHCSISQYFS